MLNAERLQRVAEQAPSEVREYLHRGEALDWADEVKKGIKTIKEMIGTDDGAEDFLKKINYDLAEGEELEPLLYKNIYETVSDESMSEVFVDELFGDFQVVFLKKLEGGEVTFGALGPGEEKIVRIHTYAAGLEYTEDMVVYNKLFQITRAGRAFGRAYNKLLNHLHLGPIITASYVATGSDLADQKEAQDDGTAQLVEFNTSIEQTLMDAVQVFPNGRYMLINSFDRPRVEAAITASLNPDLSGNVVKRTLSPENFIVYDGTSITVGKRTYTYTGVTAGEMFIVSGSKENFVEYIKHDLRVDSGDGNLSRLIVEQIVGRARRGVSAAVGGENGAIKVELES